MTSDVSIETEKHSLKKEIVKYCQKLDQKEFGANHDGNISVKCGDFFLATPTAVSKGNVIYDIIIVLDENGNKIEGAGKPFSEIKLHLAAYRAREDAQAVVHAHPPFATARGLLDLPIIPALPEAIVSLGDIIPVVPFRMPGTEESESLVIEALQEVDAFIVKGNGVFTVGENIEQAYLRLELVEHLAKIDYYAKSMGHPMELSSKDVEVLLEKRAKAGLGPKNKKSSLSFSRDKRSEIVSSSVSEDIAPQLKFLKLLIAEELKKIIGKS